MDRSTEPRGSDSNHFGGLASILPSTVDDERVDPPSHRFETGCEVRPAHQAFVQAGYAPNRRGSPMRSGASRTPPLRHPLRQSSPHRCVPALALAALVKTLSRTRRPRATGGTDRIRKIASREKGLPRDRPASIHTPSGNRHPNGDEESGLIGRGPARPLGVWPPLGDPVPWGRPSPSWNWSRQPKRAP